jgi:hypothetical protein
MAPNTDFSNIKNVVNRDGQILIFMDKSQYGWTIMKYLSILVLLVISIHLKREHMAYVVYVFALSFIICLFLLAIILNAMLLFDTRPLFVLSEKGIRYNYYLTAWYFIQWSDIQSMKIYQIKSSGLTRFTLAKTTQQNANNRWKTILIFVNDSSYYLSQTAGLNKWLLLLNNKYYGTPFILPSGISPIDTEILLGKMQSMIDKAKQ